MQRSIALVDCNNFYVSCERLFQPGLEGKPVVVLSNNDGCVVSRSQEVKDLGINMAVPWFQMKDIAKRHGIIALSSNYALYADISNRVMRLLSQWSPNQEVYSIDESFLDLTGMAGISNLTGMRKRYAAPSGNASASRCASASRRARRWPNWPTMSPKSRSSITACATSMR